MTLARSLLIAGLIVFPLGAGAATMQNNSDSINLDPLTQQSSGGSEGGGSESSDSGNTNTSNPTPPATPPPTPEPTGAGEVVVTVGGGPGGEDGSVSGSGSEDANANGGDIVESLQESGAISNPSTSLGVPNSGGQSSEGVFISGGRTREVLSSAGISKITIRGWDPLTKRFITVEDGKVPPGGSPLARTNAEVGLVAASAAMDDFHLGQILIDGHTVDLEYRTSGRILLFIPKTFTMYVHVDASAATPETRVSLKYPWYRWFMWLTVPQKEIRRVLEEAIINVGSSESDQDQGARLFVAVSSALKALHTEYERGIKLILI